MSSSGVTQSIASLIGPPSELISISAFLASDAHAQSQQLVAATRDMWSGISQHEMYDIEKDMSVADLKGQLHQTWDNPALSTYILKEQESSTNALYLANAKNKRSSRKRYLPEVLPQEVVALQKELGGVQLQSWKMELASSLFVRPPRNADYNTLNQLVRKEGSSNSEGMMSGVRCGCAVNIEDVLYGDSSGGAPDYADQVLSQLKAKNREESPISIKRSPLSLNKVKISDLSICLHKPYTILHSGNCEHFLVFEQIRLQHPSDPVGGYPQVLQVTPPLQALCRTCHRVPAIWSVAGDVRLGETPCLLCEHCWSSMGPADKEDEVTVVALPFLPSVVP